MLTGDILRSGVHASNAKNKHRVIVRTRVGDHNEFNPEDVPPEKKKKSEKKRIWEVIVGCEEEASGQTTCYPE